MKKMDYQNVKGTKDYLPNAEEVRREIRRTLEDVFIQFGCRQIETPILNYSELLASKYGGGAEILEEMYTLTDRGNRNLALRYDLTIPFAKVVAMNPTLRMPFKRYEIGKVFRDGPIKTGRSREFTQCDVDVVGVDSQIAEAELMIMALDAFRRLDLKIMIQYNNRKLLIGLLEVFGAEKEKVNKVVLVLDKLEKIGLESVITELDELGLSSSSINSIKRFLINEQNTDFRYLDSIAQENDQVRQGLAELSELESYLKFLGIENQCVFNPFLARGLEIYTGTIYEIFLLDQSIKSSIGSGGRYDNAIGGLIGSNESFSTVGISFGLDVIYTAMSLKENQVGNPSNIDYYLIPLKTEKESFLVANDYRNKGFNVEYEMGDKKLGRALEKANKERIPKVIIVGEDEVRNNVIRIRDMCSGEETIESFIFKRS